MKKALLLLTLLPSLSHARFNACTGCFDFEGNPTANATNYILNTSTHQTPSTIFIDSGSITTLNVPGLTTGQCVQAGTDGLLTTAGFACSAGGGGGTSSLQVTQSGVQVTSPTASINFLGPPFIGTAIGGTTAQISLNPSSVTLQGQPPFPSSFTTLTSSGIAFGSAKNTITQDTTTLTYTVPNGLVVRNNVALTAGATNALTLFNGSGYSTTASSSSLVIPWTNTSIYPSTSGISWQSMIELQNGKILIVGGEYATLNSGADVQSTGCYVYDPTANTFTQTGALNNLRVSPNLLLLANGDVMVIGGRTVITSGTPLSSVEIWNHISGVWTSTGSMNTARYRPGVWQLNTGDILVAGGGSGGGSFTPQNTTELFNRNTGAWTTLSTNLPHTVMEPYYFSLGDGTPVIAGGQNSSVGFDGTYGWTSNAGWTVISSSPIGLHASDIGHVAQLSNGDIMIAGAAVNAGSFLNDSSSTTLVFHPVSRSWEVVGNLNNRRQDAILESLPNGDAFISMGFIDPYLHVTTAETYSHLTKQWTLNPAYAIGPEVTFATDLHTSSGGFVLGGWDITGNPNVVTKNAGFFLGVPSIFTLNISTIDPLSSVDLYWPTTPGQGPLYNDGSGHLGWGFGQNILVSTVSANTMYVTGAPANRILTSNGPSGAIGTSPNLFWDGIGDFELTNTLVGNGSTLGLMDMRPGATNNSATLFNLHAENGSFSWGSGTPTLLSLSVAAGTNPVAIDVQNGATKIETLTANQCVQTDSNKNLVSSGGACGGSGGGASALAVSSGSSAGSTIVSSPTANILFDSNTLIVSALNTTTGFVQLNPSSVTLQGNAISIAGLNTIVNNKVAYSSFSATLPITYNNATGVIGATQISLSTGAMNILPTTLMVSTVAYTSSTQTFTAPNTFQSSTTLTPNSANPYTLWIATSPPGTVGITTYVYVSTGGLNAAAIMSVNNSTNSTVPVMILQGQEELILNDYGLQNAMQINEKGTVSTSFTTGGAFNIFMDTITHGSGMGSGMVIYSPDNAPIDNLVNLRTDSPAYSQNMLFISGSGSSHLLSINNTSTGTASSAANIVSSNPNLSALQVSGSEVGFGTAKMSHTGTGTDASSSVLSLDMLGTGTASQGLFIKSSAGNGTTGKLVNIRNPNIERFVILSSGSVDISPSTGVPYALFISTTPGQTLDNVTIWISTNAEFVVNGSTGTSGQVLSSQGPGLPVKWIAQSAGGGGGGIIYPATFTWVDNFGIYGSTFTMVNSTVPTTLSVSTSATGVSQLAVSSTVAVNPTDPILSISSTSGTTILWLDNAGNLISSGTTTTVTSCGTSPAVAGNNIAGQITVGGGVVTACTLNFANGGFVNPPICVFSDNSTTVNPSLGATSGSSVVINLSATLGGGLINYLCTGYQK